MTFRAVALGDAGRVVVTLLTALAGAALASALGVPAGALLGATVAVTLLAVARFDARLPTALRDLGFATIGVTLGVGVTPAFLSDLARFATSLAALAVTVIAVIVAGAVLLRRRFGTERDTAVLAMSPGALTYTLALAAAPEARHRDAVTVTVVQSLRLLLITLLLPPLVAVVDSGASSAAVASSSPEPIGLPLSSLLIGGAWLLGLLCRRARVPAPFLIGGVLLSGLGHGAGLLEGRPAESLLFAGFAIAGAVIGTRFAAVTGGALLRHVREGLFAAALALSLSAAVAFAVSRHLALPFGQVWIAFAPGGVEAMSAMALALGYDPVYVATHHVFRLLLLMVLLPLLLRRAD